MADEGTEPDELTSSEATVTAPAPSPSVPKTGLLSGYSRAEADLDKASKAMEGRAAAGKKAAAVIRGRNDSISDIVDRIGGMSEDFDKTHEAPSYTPQKFTAPPKTPPLEAFGSFASTLGILASLLTKQPLTGALNASAAAMNAYKANDVETYNRSFKEFQTQSEYAFKQAQFESDQYRTAMDLMKTDMNGAIAQVRMIAAQNHDEAMLAALENPDPAGFINLSNARDTLTKNTIMTYDDVFRYGQFNQWMMEYPAKHGGAQPPAEEAASMFNKFTQSPSKMLAAAQSKPENQLYQQVVADLTEKNGGKSPTAEAIADAYGKALTKAGLSPMQRKMTPEENLIQDYKAKYRLEHNGEDPPFDEELSFRASVSRAKKSSDKDALLKAKIEADTKNSPIKHPQQYLFQERVADAEKAKGEPLTADEKTEIWHDVMKGGLTGNQKDKLQARVDQYGHSLTQLDEAMALVDKHLGATGAFGYANRLQERVGNLFGSNKTDYDRFLRLVQNLRLNGTSLLTGRDGRPLSAEAERINQIISGLGIGDTTANTKRQLSDVRDQYLDFRKQTMSRVKGTWTPTGSQPASDAAPAATPVVPAPQNAPWLKAPLVQ